MVTEQKKQKDKIPDIPDDKIPYTQSRIQIKYIKDKYPLFMILP